MYPHDLLFLFPQFHFDCNTIFKLCPYLPINQVLPNHSTTYYRRKHSQTISHTPTHNNKHRTKPILPGRDQSTGHVVRENIYTHSCCIHKCVYLISLKIHSFRGIRIQQKTIKRRGTKIRTTSKYGCLPQRPPCEMTIEAQFESIITNRDMTRREKLAQKNISTHQEVKREQRRKNKNKKL